MGMFDVLREAKQSGKIQESRRSRQERRERAGGRARRVRVPSAALRAGMRRSTETWRSVHLLPRQPGSCRPSSKLWQRRNHGWGDPLLSRAAHARAAGTRLGAEAHEFASRHFLRSAFTSLLEPRRSSHPPPLFSSSPRLPGRTSHLSSPAPTPATHLTGIIISHDGTTILRGLKHEINLRVFWVESRIYPFNPIHGWKP